MSWIISVSPELNKKVKNVASELGKLKMDIDDARNVLIGIESTIKTLDTLLVMLRKLPDADEKQELIDKINETIQVASGAKVRIEKRIEELEEALEEYGVSV